MEVFTLVCFTCCVLGGLFSFERLELGETRFAIVRRCAEACVGRHSSWGWTQVVRPDLVILSGTRGTSETTTWGPREGTICENCLVWFFQRFARTCVLRLWL